MTTAEVLLRITAAWLRDIAYILEPPSAQVRNGDEVAAQLRSYLDAIRRINHVSPAIYDFGLHLDKVSRSYWLGRFYCYEVAGLPRTNNEIESHFRDTGRQLLRITAQKGLTGRTLQRQGDVGGLTLLGNCYRDRRRRPNCSTV